MNTNVPKMLNATSMSNDPNRAADVDEVMKATVIQNVSEFLLKLKKPVQVLTAVQLNVDQTQSVKTSMEKFNAFVTWATLEVGQTAKKFALKTQIVIYRKNALAQAPAKRFAQKMSVLLL